MSLDERTVNVGGAEALRVCPLCDKHAYSETDLLDFLKDKSSKYGRKNTCSSCHNRKVRGHGEEERAKIRKRSRNWSRANPAKVINAKLLNRYGISLSDYESMLKSQNYSCSICDKHEDELTKKLAVDHDHASGGVRGLLCVRCNLALGHFDDDVSSLTRAISYLRDHQ